MKKKPELIFRLAIKSNSQANLKSPNNLCLYFQRHNYVKAIKFPQGIISYLGMTWRPHFHSPHSYLFRPSPLPYINVKKYNHYILQHTHLLLPYTYPGPQTFPERNGRHPSYTRLVRYLPRPCRTREPGR